MGTLRLIPHPDTPPKGIQSVNVRWFETGEKLILRYQVNGVEALHVPGFAGKGRGDDLWQTTCFELFLRDRDGSAYREFNFSPSERWAAYRFSGYRAGRSDAEPPELEISSSAGERLFIMTATLDTAILAGATVAGLSAVVEEKDGTKSYWALAHPSGKPDFHDPACFTLPLPAAG